MKNKLQIIILGLLFLNFTYLFSQEKSKLDKELIKKLALIQKEDQESRNELIKIWEEKGNNSKESKEFAKKMNQKDSINVLKIIKILDERGWLGKDIIGKEGNTTLFLVIQHASHKVQKKYLPMLKDAVKKGNAQPNFLAMLEDRIAVRDGKKQIYGSQIMNDKVTGGFYVPPIIDPKNVDKRRSKVGLGSLSDYISNWGLKWDVDKHIERTKQLELKNNKI